MVVRDKQLRKSVETKQERREEVKKGKRMRKDREKTYTTRISQSRVLPVKGGTGLSLIEVTSSGREGSSVRNCSGAGSRNFAVFRGVDMNSGPWPGCYGFEIGRCPLTGGICCISLVHNFIYILSMAWKVELLEKKLLILLHWLSPLAPRHRSRLSYMQLRHLIKGLDKCQVKGIDASLFNSRPPMKAPQSPDCGSSLPAHPAPSSPTPF